MALTGREKTKSRQDPSNRRLWVAVLLFVFVVQDLVVPKSILIRFINHLLFGLIFQFVPSLTEPWVVLEQGLTFLLLGWLFLRSIHRPIGTLGATAEAWKIGVPWGLAMFLASTVLLVGVGGAIAGFNHIPPVFWSLPAQFAQMFNGLGKALCLQGFFQSSVVLLSLRYLKRNDTASTIGIGASTILIMIVQAPELARSGLEGIALAAALIHVSLVFGLIVSLIYAYTNNLVLAAMLYGGYYAMSYWTVSGLYTLFPAHIYLVTAAAVLFVALKSNPKALNETPIAAQIELVTSRKE